jgi:dolichyl-phosphate-mannose-protein mannosyltransferase
MKNRLVFITVLLIIVMLHSTPRAAENLVNNGGFEEFTSELPSGWFKDVWDANEENTRFYSSQKDAKSGTNCLVIENKVKNDSKLVQNVPVKADTVYKLSCWIKAENIGQDAKGANIGVLYITETSEDFKDTHGEWRYIEFYGRTGKDQKELKVMARLGGYSSINVGTAYFDNFSVEEIKEVPDNVQVVKFYNNNYNNSGQNTGKKINDISSVNFSGIISIIFVFILISAIGIKLIKSKRAFEARLDKKKEALMLIGILAIGLTARLVIAQQVRGHSIDINCFKYWSNLAAEKGLSEFYISGVFVDYPPGYVYVLYLIGKIRQIFSISMDSVLFEVLIKLPSIAADIVGSYLIYKLAKSHLGRVSALTLSLLYIFNPSVIINSAAWGQIDSFFTLFAVVTILLVVEDRLELASVVYTLGVLVKPQMLIFTPILLFAFFSKAKVKVLGLSALYSFIVFIIVILPFSIKQRPLWILEKYITTLKSYPYASVNAFNLFGATGGNWVSDSTRLLFLPYKTWGIIFILAIVAYSGFIFIKSKEGSRYYYIGFFIISSVFILSSKMHERYLFPAIILALLWYVCSEDIRILYLYLAITVSHYINVAYVFKADKIGIIHIPSKNLILVFTGIINVLLLAYIVKIGLDLYYFHKTVKADSSEASLGSFKSINETARHTENKINRFRMMIARDDGKGKKLSKRDYTLMSILVVGYTIIALIRLGSLNVPQSHWKPYSRGEYVIADLGEQKEIRKIYYFAGLGNGVYSVSFSQDSQSWGNELNINLKNIYKWDNTSVNIRARYVKVASDTPGGMLNELGFFGKEDEAPLPIVNVTSHNVNPKTEGKSENIFDEQRMIVYRPSFMHGMYFDEIYHGRTAYEHIYRIKPYEWTHPPLGKLLIAIGILIFGMNPFGWRIVGAVFGMAMIPLMYIFAKKLFHKSEYAFIAAFLMTFDFMHFTQTRLATIDVYTVFFTILMYYFMYKYVNTGFYNGNFNKVLMTLGLSGLFFAFGAATKWSVVYGGLGLAVIFFKDLYDRYSEYKMAEQLIKYNKFRNSKEADVLRKIVRSFPKKAAVVIAGGILFFIIVPVLVYLLSYLPYMVVPGEGNGIRGVLNYQSQMYNYHSKLQASHPFSSNWWEWPIIRKPIWYYTGQAYLPEGKISSIVSMGNPAIWWVGIPAVIASATIGIRKKDKAILFVLVAALSQYLPWVLVPRLTFIYHFFSAVPFVILCITYVIKHIKEGYRNSRRLVYGYLAVVALLFVMFYPVMSGLVVSREYVSRFLKWFETWYFYS